MDGTDEQGGGEGIDFSRNMKQGKIKYMKLELVGVVLSDMKQGEWKNVTHGCLETVNGLTNWTGGKQKGSGSTQRLYVERDGGKKKQ